MSDYFQTFKDLVNQKQFQSDNSLMDRNKEVFADNFDTSPLSTTVTVNDVNTVAMVRQEKDSNKKKLIFRPDTKIDIGSVIRIKSSYYLTLDFLSEGINEVYPTAKVQLCNSTLPIQSGKTRVLIGHDRDGRPVYKDEYAVNKLEPCIAETKYLSSNENDQLPLPEGRINITLKYQEADNIQPNKQFSMYGNTFKITDIDLTKVINGKGIMIVSAERIPEGVVKA